MLDKYAEKDSFGFLFTERPGSSYANLSSVGWKVETMPSYSWHGLKRKDTGHLFQYTLSGGGILRAGSMEHRIRPGQAFLVSIPGDHHYYLPERSDPWEFIYVMFTGDGLAKDWAKLRHLFGDTPAFDRESPIIRSLFDLYLGAHNKQIVDGYQAASLAYSFVMDLFRSTLQRNSRDPESRPQAIARALEYAKQCYAEPIGLAEMAEVSNLSKYHFSRLFYQCTGLTPVRYLTKLRIQKAVELLRGSAITTEQIAKEIGYANGNYFCKVFRKIMGVSPGDFRSGKKYAPVDHLMIDG